MRLEAIPFGESSPGLELQDDPNGIWFEIVVGGLDDVSTVRGRNLIVPRKPGEVWQPKVEAGTPVTLAGTIFGEPGAGAAQSYLERTLSVLDVFDPTAEPITLVIHPDATGVGGGLAAGETATIEVEFLRKTGDPSLADRWGDVELECRAIGNPPVWIVEGSS